MESARAGAAPRSDRACRERSRRRRGPSTSRFENQATPFESLYHTIGEAYPERHRYLADAMWSDEPAAEVLAAIREHVARAPSARSHVLCALLPPMPLRDGALSMAARLYVASYAVWSDPAHDVANADWHRSVTGALTPFATGYYVGESDVIGDAARARRCFAPAARARLADVRRAYDPVGLFHTVLDD